jgi:hypothetical protein
LVANWLLHPTIATNANCNMVRAFMAALILVPVKGGYFQRQILLLTFRELL